MPALAATDACADGDSKEARSLADRSYAQGDYQRAGDCYQAAGDLAAANEAFLKAVQPNAKANAQALRTQADTAKALFTRVAHAFHGDH
jgi:tetratricopeptide (TPR) repeat protein